jgi:hypothetical protein
LAQSQFRDDGQNQQGGDVTSFTPGLGAKRVPGTPMEDPDVEAFLRDLAWEALRQHGLAGKVYKQAGHKEEEHESA